MYIKKFRLENYRKFYKKENTINFVSSKLLENKNMKEKEIDVASDTTLIIGKNNAGKTTIITALDNLINKPSAFGINDFNYRYLAEYLKNYKTSSKENVSPYIEFAITIELEEDSDDRISNLIPFMLIEDVNDTELEIRVRYELVDEVYFHNEMKKIIEKFNQTKDIEKKIKDFYKLLRDTKFKLNYYDKNNNRIDSEFRLSNLFDIKCIKANLLKKDNCLSEAFNKIVQYRYNKLFADKKEKISDDLEDINETLSKEIKENHTVIVEDVIKQIISLDKMSVNIKADITFEKLMKDLVKYEYIENGLNIPEDQFGLGYTNLVMIIAEIIDYLERYPEDDYNSKINIVTIEEPETYMHPQMQELFIKNINNAIKTLLGLKSKNLNTQIVITTHSPHILNSKIQSKNTFDNICYLCDVKGDVCVSNLSNEVIMPNHKTIQKKDFEFLKSILSLRHQSCFFRMQLYL